MKNIIDFINEALLTEGEIKSEKDFRDAAKAKFEEVFGDELDEKEMNDTIEGILKDNSELVEKGDWGALIGILNKSFAN
jgi:hypothetical protein